MEWLTLFAIVIGPIAAVIITRLMDARSEKSGRRHQIFRDLMRTRSAKISHEHVTALNLVEIEFYQDGDVKSAWKAYMDNLSESSPTNPDRQKAFFDKRDQLFLKLMQTIANRIGFKKIDITDIMSLNYYPQGWVNDEEEQKQLRSLLIQTFSGLRPIPIKYVDNSKWNGPYPPLTHSANSEREIPLKLPAQPSEQSTE